LVQVGLFAKLAEGVFGSLVVGVVPALRAIGTMHSPFSLPAALMLSVGAHLCIGFALGNRQGADTVAVPWQTQAVKPFVVSFRVPAKSMRAMKRIPAVDAPIEFDAAHPEELVSTEVASVLLDDDGQALLAKGIVSNKEPSLIPIVMPPEPHYFVSSELTERPRVLRDISAEQRRILPDLIPGRSLVQLLINERGEVDQVVIADSRLSEEGKRFVIETLDKIIFIPGKLNGTLVKSQLRIEVTLETVTSAQYLSPNAPIAAGYFSR
jgi:hypothetical protein